MYFAFHVLIAHHKAIGIVIQIIKYLINFSKFTQ